MPAVSFHLADQLGWAHDEGHAAGIFHTFDRLDVGAGTPSRKVHVFVPRGLRADAERLPVVWMNDGDTAFWPGGPAKKTWGMAEVLSTLGAHVRPMIVVAVHAVDRNEEYTHVDWREGRERWGGLPAYADYLANDLRLFLTRHYPMSLDPADHLVLGSSHGALAAFWSATRHPEAFGNAACLSTSFFAGLDSLDGDASDARLADAPILADVMDLLRDAARRPRLYLSWGTERTGGPHNAVVEAFAAQRGEEAVSLLTAAGYTPTPLRHGAAPPAGADLYVMVDEGGGHEEHAWSEQLPLVLRAFFPR